MQTNGHHNDVNGTETENVTSRLASFIVDTKQENLSIEVIQKLRELILDHIGVGILGAHAAESSAPFLRAVEALSNGYPGTNTVFGTRKRFPAPYAAMLNAAYAHSLDFDDTHAESYMHPGVVVIAVVLAEVEGRSDVTFRDALLALAVGYEVTVRIGVAVGTGGHERGFHTTSTVGIFGGVAALAKLRGFNATVTENALGCALSWSSGTMQWLENGSWNKRMNPGIAAFNAFSVATFAQAGMLGASKAIEGKFGFLAAYSGSSETKDKIKDITKALGNVWKFKDTALKPFPACRLTHAHVELAASLSKGNTVDGVKNIHIVMDESNFPIVGVPAPNKIHSTTIVEAQFSVYYQTAAAWIYGSGLGWSVYDHLDDASVHELCDKITVESKKMSTKSETTMKAVLQDGTEEILTSNAPPWEVGREPSLDDVRQKFDSLVLGVLGDDRTSRIADWIAKSVDVPTKELFTLLTL